MPLRPSAPLVFRHGKVGWDAHQETLRVADRRWTMRLSYGRFIDRLGRPLAILLFGAEHPGVVMGFVALCFVAMLGANFWFVPSMATKHSATKPMTTPVDFPQ